MGLCRVTQTESLPLDPPEHSSSAPSSLHRAAPDAALFGVAVIWGLNIAIIKIGLEQTNLYVFSGVRLSVSALVLVLFAWRERRNGILPKPGIKRRQLFLYGTMIGAAYQLLFLFGVAWTTAGNTALIISTVPMWTALFARVFLHERIRPRAWCGLLVALTGTVIVALQKGDVSSGVAYRLGNGMILAAALIWAAGTVYSRPLLRLISPLQLAASSSVIALPFHLALASVYLPSHAASLWSVPVWLIILYSGILSSGLAQPMWHFGVRQAGAAHAAVIQNAIPLVAIAAAWIIRDVPPTSAQLFGGSLILGGVVLMRLGR